MKKFLFLIGLIVFLLMIIIGYSSIQKKPTETTKDELKISELIKYELKTSEYYEYLYNVQNKYYINSEYELDKFYSLFSNKLNINKGYLKNNTVFIQVRQVGSGSISMNLENVTFENNNVNFVVNEEYPEIGTTDMACWYLVAIIPNDKLQGIKFDNWIKPSDVKF